MPVMRYLEALKSLRELDPVRALRTWLTMAGIDSGPIFRHVDRWGNLRSGSLSGSAASEVVKEAAEACGLDRGGVQRAQPASRVRVRMRPEARALGCGADGHRPPDRRHVELVQPARAAFRRLRRGVLRGGLVRTS